ncbi:MAG: hypothetical protein FWC51_00275 [Proteobacteria bacterium]|nr:hypothetical protein [Pseudomonadota bacterium]
MIVEDSDLITITMSGNEFSDIQEVIRKMALNIGDYSRQLGYGQMEDYKGYIEKLKRLVVNNYEEKSKV